MEPAFRDFLLARESKAPITVKEMARVLARMRERGWDALSLTSRESALVEADRYLGTISTNGYGERKANVAVLNALFRWKALGCKLPFPKSPRHQPSRYTTRETDALRSWTSQDPLLTLRNNALVDFALQTAMRRVEVSRLNARDLDEETKSLEIPKPAKGGLRRKIPLDKQFMEPGRPFMSWLRARPILKTDPDAVWIRWAPSGAVSRFPENELGSLMSMIGRDVGVRANFVRSRHTRATQLLERGLHVRYLQTYLGHASLKSTMVYLEADDGDLHRAFNSTRGQRRD